MQKQNSEQQMNEAKNKQKQNENTKKQKKNDIQAPSMFIFTLKEPPVALERGADSSAQNHLNPHSPVIVSDEVKEGKENYQETNLDVGIPHVLHMCALEPLDDHRMDHIPTDTNQEIQVNDHAFKEDYCEIGSSVEEDKSSDMRIMIKGKGHAASDIQIQSHKSKNKPNQKKRRAMRRKSISTVQHLVDGIDEDGNLPRNKFQSLVTKMRWITRYEDERSSKVKGYQDKGLT